MSAAMDTGARLNRLLAILTWLAQEGEVPIDEVAARFDLTPGALVAELEMAACCGVPPYSPDQLLEIIVTDESVSTRIGTVCWDEVPTPSWPLVLYPMAQSVAFVLIKKL